jgi:hypothetical protein
MGAELKAHFEKMNAGHGKMLAKMDAWLEEMKG